MIGTCNPLNLLGGAERDRTVGLLNAIQALSQLSYSPTEPKFNTEGENLSIILGFDSLKLVLGPSLFSNCLS